LTLTRPELGLSVCVCVLILTTASFSGLYLADQSEMSSLRTSLNGQVASLSQQVSNLTTQVSQIQHDQDQISKLRGFSVTNVTLSMYSYNDNPFIVLPVVAPNLNFTLTNTANDSITTVVVYVDGAQTTKSSIGFAGDLPLPPSQTTRWGIVSDQVTTPGTYEITFIVTFQDGSVHSYEALTVIK